MDAYDFATSVAHGLGIELPPPGDLDAWDRLSAGAARLARELKFPLDGCDPERRCVNHPREFVMRTHENVYPGADPIVVFTCGCRIYPYPKSSRALSFPASDLRRPTA